jgi:SAM-dependent methyltransferase
MLPLPPDELIYRVVGSFTNDQAAEHRESFLESGKRSLEDWERTLAAVGDRIDRHERILEFGCGCGRVMRWMQELSSTRTLVGTDIDERAISWANRELPFARFDVNPALPPTPYSDGEFDLVLNHSVFTHLDANYQDRWLDELQRITAPGGILVLSTHGEHAFHVTEEELAGHAREWRDTLERDGILFVSEDSFVGGAFPDFYHSTFHAPWYVFEHWSEWFEVLAYLPKSSLDFQDHVVLRRPRETPHTAFPIRARPSGGTVSAPPSEPQVDTNSIEILAPLAGPSRFGAAGLLARRALFRVARPILCAQNRVDRALAERIAELDVGVKHGMSSFVRDILRQQAERIDRLDRELEHVRASRGADVRAHEDGDRS